MTISLSFEIVAMNFMKKSIEEKKMRKKIIFTLNIL